jgi:hypothetical protein
MARSKRLTGTGVQDGLIEAARTLGYLVFHINAENAIGNEPGFPDLVIVGHGRCIVIECKSQREPFRAASETKRGRWMPGQLEWLGAFTAAGVDAFVCRPEQAAQPDQALYREVGYDGMLQFLQLAAGR